MKISKKIKKNLFIGGTYFVTALAMIITMVFSGFSLGIYVSLIIIHAAVISQIKEDFNDSIYIEE